jgi:hypothetical protein
MPRKYRPRKEFKFWLYHDRNDDSRLMEFIQYCKSTRQFAKVVRDGIRLIWSLREGNTSVLFELFPHLERQFNPDAENLIAEFRDMLLQHRNQPAPQPVHIESSVGQAEQGRRKLLRAKKLDLPLLDDDDDGDTLVMTKKSGPLNGGNLLSGILGLD